MLDNIYGFSYVSPMNNMTTFFKTLSDDTRLRILMLLHREEALCVCELCEALDTHQPMISRHLAEMRKSGLVDSQRQSRWVFYSIAPDLPEWSVNVLSEVVSGADGSGPFVNDHKRLSMMQGRPKRAVA